MGRATTVFRSQTKRPSEGEVVRRREESLNTAWKGYRERWVLLNEYLKYYDPFVVYNSKKNPVTHGSYCIQTARHFAQDQLKRMAPTQWYSALNHDSEFAIWRSHFFEHTRKNPDDLEGEIILSPDEFIRIRHEEEKKPTPPPVNKNRWYDAVHTANARAARAVGDWYANNAHKPENRVFHQLGQFLAYDYGYTNSRKVPSLRGLVTQHLASYEGQMPITFEKSQSGNKIRLPATGVMKMIRAFSSNLDGEPLPVVDRLEQEAIIRQREAIPLPSPEVRVNCNNLDTARKQRNIPRSPQKVTCRVPRTILPAGFYNEVYVEGEGSIPQYTYLPLNYQLRVQHPRCPNKTPEDACADPPECGPERKQEIPKRQIASLSFATTCFEFTGKWERSQQITRLTQSAVARVIIQPPYPSLGEAVVEEVQVITDDQPIQTINTKMTEQEPETCSASRVNVQLASSPVDVKVDDVTETNMSAGELLLFQAIIADASPVLPPVKNIPEEPMEVEQEPQKPLPVSEGLQVGVGDPLSPPIHKFEEPSVSWAAISGSLPGLRPNLTVEEYLELFPFVHTPGQAQLISQFMCPTKPSSFEGPARARTNRVLKCHYESKINKHPPTKRSRGRISAPTLYLKLASGINERRHVVVGGDELVLVGYMPTQPYYKRRVVEKSTKRPHCVAAQKKRATLSRFFVHSQSGTYVPPFIEREKKRVGIAKMFENHKRVIHEEQSLLIDVAQHMVKQLRRPRHIKNADSLSVWKILLLLMLCLIPVMSCEDATSRFVDTNIVVTGVRGHCLYEVCAKDDETLFDAFGRAYESKVCPVSDTLMKLTDKEISKGRSFCLIMLYDQEKDRVAKSWADEELPNSAQRQHILDVYLNVVADQPAIEPSFVSVVTEYHTVTRTAYIHRTRTSYIREQCSDEIYSDIQQCMSDHPGFMGGMGLKHRPISTLPPLPKIRHTRHSRLPQVAALTNGIALVALFLFRPLLLAPLLLPIVNAAFYFESMDPINIQYTFDEFDTKYFDCPQGKHALMPYYVAPSVEANMCFNFAITTDHDKTQQDCLRCFATGLACSVRTQVEREGDSYRQYAYPICVDPIGFMQSDMPNVHNILNDLPIETKDVVTYFKLLAGRLSAGTTLFLAIIAGHFVLSIRIGTVPSFLIFALAILILPLLDGVSANDEVQFEFDEVRGLCFCNKPSGRLVILTRGSCPVDNEVLLDYRHNKTNVTIDDHTFFAYDRSGICYEVNAADMRYHQFKRRAQQKCNDPFDEQFDDTTLPPLPKVPQPPTLPKLPVLNVQFNGPRVNPPQRPTTAKPTPPPPTIRKPEEQNMLGGSIPTAYLQQKPMEVVKHTNVWMMGRFTKSYSKIFNILTHWRLALLFAASSYLSFLYFGPLGLVFTISFFYFWNALILTHIYSSFNMVFSIAIFLFFFYFTKSLLISSVLFAIGLWVSPAGATCTHAFAGTLIGHRITPEGKFINVTDGTIDVIKGTCLMWNTHENGTTVNNMIKFQELKHKILVYEAYKMVGQFHLDDCFAYKCGGQFDYNQDCTSQMTLVQRGAQYYYPKNIANEINVGHVWPCAFQMYVKASYAISWTAVEECTVYRLTDSHLVSMLYELTKGRHKQLINVTVTPHVETLSSDVYYSLISVDYDQFPKYMLTCGNLHFFINDEFKMPERSIIYPVGGHPDPVNIHSYVNCEGADYLFDTRWKCNTKLRGALEAFPAYTLSPIDNITFLKIFTQTYLDVQAVHLRIRIPGAIAEISSCPSVSARIIHHLTFDVDSYHYGLLEITAVRVPCEFLLPSINTDLCFFDTQSYLLNSVKTRVTLKALCSRAGWVIIKFGVSTLNLTVGQMSMWDYVHNLKTVTFNSIRGINLNDDTLINKITKFFTSGIFNSTTLIALVVAVVIFNINPVIALIFIAFIFIFGVVHASDGLGHFIPDVNLVHLLLFLCVVFKSNRLIVALLLLTCMSELLPAAEACINQEWLPPADPIMDRLGFGLFTRNFLTTFIANSIAFIFRHGITPPLDSTDVSLWGLNFDFYIMTFFMFFIIFMAASRLVSSCIFCIFLHVVFYDSSFSFVCCYLCLCDIIVDFYMFLRRSSLCNNSITKTTGDFVCTLCNTKIVLCVHVSYCLLSALYSDACFSCALLLFIYWTNTLMFGTRFIFSIHCLIRDICPDYADIVTNHPYLFNLRNDDHIVYVSKFDKCTQYEEQPYCFKHKGECGKFDDNGTFVNHTLICGEGVTEMSCHPVFKCDCEGCCRNEVYCLDTGKRNTCPHCSPQLFCGYRFRTTIPQIDILCTLYFLIEQLCGDGATHKNKIINQIFSFVNNIVNMYLGRLATFATNYFCSYQNHMELLNTKNILIQIQYAKQQRDKMLRVLGEQPTEDVVIQPAPPDEQPGTSNTLTAAEREQGLPTYVLRDEEVDDYTSNDSTSTSSLPMEEPLVMNDAQVLWLQMHRAMASAISQAEKLYIGASVQYTFSQHIGLLFGIRSQFDHQTYCQIQAPHIYEICTGTSMGFGFYFQGVIYTSYHVTGGRDLVVPMSYEPGKYKMTQFAKSTYDARTDIACYGGNPKLPQPKIGAWYYTANPASQQMIMFRCESIDGSTDVKQVKFQRYVEVNDGQMSEAKSIRCFNFYGWSGLPIIDCSTGLPCGIFGYMKRAQYDTNVYVVSSGLAHLMPAVNWNLEAQNLISNNSDNIIDINAPTGSGKSTYFVIAIAQELLRRKGNGLIVCCNPLKVVPRAVTDYVNHIITSQNLHNRISVECSVGGASTNVSPHTLMLRARNKVVILYVSYGKFIHYMKSLKGDVLLLDETHTQHETVHYTVEYYKRLTELKHNDSWKHIANLTATPRDGVTKTDRPIQEIAVHSPIGHVANPGDFVRLTEDFYFDVREYSDARKHLIFLPTKAECESARKAIKSKIKHCNVFTFYSEHPKQNQELISFNLNRTAILIATNAIESGLTPIGCTDVWDSQREIVIEIHGHRVEMLRRWIDQRSITQRRGRAGRTTSIANYWFPHESECPLSHPTAALVKFKTAVIAHAQNLDPMFVADSYMAEFETLAQLYMDVRLLKWQLLMYCEVDPMSFFNLAENFTASDGPNRGKPLLYWNPSTIRACFSKSLDAGRVKMNSLINTFPTDPKVPFNRIEHPYLNNLADESEYNNQAIIPIITGTAAAIFAFWASFELMSHFSSFARVTSAYIINGKNFHDLCFGIGTDLVCNYTSEQAQTNFKDPDPKFIIDNQFLSKFYGTRKTIMSTTAKHMLAVVNEENKSYLAMAAVIGTSAYLQLSSKTVGTYLPNEEQQYNKINLNVIANEVPWLDFLSGMLDNYELEELTEESEVNSIGMEAALAAKYHEMLIALQTQSPTAANALTTLISTGTLIVGGISLAWDKLVKNFGPVGAFTIGVISCVSFCHPNKMIQATVGGLLAYTAKTLVIGKAVFDDGTILQSTPLALGATLFVGHALSHIKTLPMSANASIGITGAGSVVSGSHASVIVCVKHLVHLYKVIKGLVTGNGATSGNSLSNLATPLFAILLEFTHMSPYQMLLCIVTSAIITALWGIAHTNNRIFRAFFASQLRHENFDNIANDWLMDIDNIIHVALTIAAFVVSPTSILSAALLSAFNVLELLLTNQNLNGQQITECLYAGCTEGAGLPIWLAAGGAIMRLLPHLNQYMGLGQQDRPGAANQQNSLGMICGVTCAAATFATAGFYIRDRFMDADFDICKDSLTCVGTWCSRQMKIIYGGFIKIWDWLKDLFYRIFCSDRETEPINLNTFGIDLWETDLPPIVENTEKFIRHLALPHIIPEFHPMLDEVIALILRGRRSAICTYTMNNIKTISMQDWLSSHIAIMAVGNVTNWDFSSLSDMVKKGTTVNVDDLVTTDCCEFVSVNAVMVGSLMLTKQGILYAFTCQLTGDVIVQQFVFYLGQYCIVITPNFVGRSYLFKEITTSTVRLMENAMGTEISIIAESNDEIVIEPRSYKLDKSDSRVMLEECVLHEYIGLTPAKSRGMFSSLRAGIDITRIWASRQTDARAQKIIKEQFDQIKRTQDLSYLFLGATNTEDLNIFSLNIGESPVFMDRNKFIAEWAKPFSILDTFCHPFLESNNVYETAHYWHQPWDAIPDAGANDNTDVSDADFESCRETFENLTESQTFIPDIKIDTTIATKKRNRKKKTKISEIKEDCQINSKGYLQQIAEYINENNALTNLREIINPQAVEVRRSTTGSLFEYHQARMQILPKLDIKKESELINAEKIKKSTYINHERVEPHLNKLVPIRPGIFQHQTYQADPNRLTTLQHSLRTRIERLNKPLVGYVWARGTVPEVNLGGYYDLADIDKLTNTFRGYRLDDTNQLESKVNAFSKTVLDWTPGRGGSSLYAAYSSHKSIIHSYQREDDAFPIFKDSIHHEKTNYRKVLNTLPLPLDHYNIVINDASDCAWNLSETADDKVVMRFLEAFRDSVGYYAGGDNDRYIFSISNVFMSHYVACVFCFGNVTFAHAPTSKPGRIRLFITAQGPITQFGTRFLNLLKTIKHPTDVDGWLHIQPETTSIENLKNWLTKEYEILFYKQLKPILNIKKRFLKPIGYLSYPRLIHTTSDYQITMSLHAVTDQTPNAAMKQALEPVPILGTWGLKQKELKNRLDRLQATCNYNGIRLLPANTFNVFQHQKVLGVYKKSDRLTNDKTLLSDTISKATHNIFGWHPTNSVVVQVSKDRLKLLESMQKRLDRPPALYTDEVINELHECAKAIRIAPSKLLKPYTFRECRPMINEQGASGIFENYGKMKEFLDDPAAEGICNLMMEDLKAGRNVLQYQVSAVGKPEAKISGRAEDGTIVEHDIAHLHPGSRLVSYFSCAARTVDWMVFGPFIHQHYKVQKTFKHTTSGTPIFEMGDVLWDAWNRFNDNKIEVPSWKNAILTENTARAVTGDASKWDHSIGTRLYGLMCEFVCSFYEEQYHKIICTIFEHVIWPIVFTRLGFCYTLTGQVLSGWILTWMNSFLNATLHNRAWKKTLGLAMYMQRELEKLVWFTCDGDDNAHMLHVRTLSDNGKDPTCTIVLNRLNHYMKQCNITIRSGPYEGYRSHKCFDTVDFLSHRYTPVPIVASPDKSQGHKILSPNRNYRPHETSVFNKPHYYRMLPYRPLSEILGKISFTQKVAAARRTAARARELLHEQHTGGMSKGGRLVDEGIQFEASKIASYLFMYPHIMPVRILCISVLSQLGFPGDVKFFRNWKAIMKFGDFDMETTELLDTPSDKFSSIQNALKSIYGSEINTLDDIGFINYEKQKAAMEQHFTNIVGCYENGYAKQNRRFANMIIPILNDPIRINKFCQHQNILHRALNHTLMEQSKLGHNDVPFPIYWYLWRPAKELYAKFVNFNSFEHNKFEKLLKTYDKHYDWQFKFTPDYYLNKVYNSLTNFWQGGEADPSLVQFSVPSTSKFFGKTRVSDMLGWLGERTGKPLYANQNLPGEEQFNVKDYVDTRPAPIPKRIEEKSSYKNKITLFLLYMFMYFIYYLIVIFGLCLKIVPRCISNHFDSFYYDATRDKPFQIAKNQKPISTRIVNGTGLLITKLIPRATKRFLIRTLAEGLAESL